MENIRLVLASHIELHYNFISRVVRYEDMALSVLDYSEVILQFLGLGVNRRVARFLASHTNSDIGGVASTYRNSKR